MDIASPQPIDLMFENHFRWLCNRLRGQLGCTFSAEDVASETFAQVLALPPATAIKEPRALLTTIAQRLVYDIWRRRDLERAYLELLAAMPEQSQPSPEESALVLQSLLAVERLLDGLSTNARAAFLYSQVDGMTYAEIAAKLKVSTARVQQYVAQGLLCCYAATST